MAKLIKKEVLSEDELGNKEDELENMEEETGFLDSPLTVEYSFDSLKLEIEEGIFPSAHRSVQKQGSVRNTTRGGLSDCQKYALWTNAHCDTKEESSTLNLSKTDGQQISPGERRCSNRIVRPTSEHTLSSYLVYRNRPKDLLSLDRGPRKPSSKLFECNQCKQMFSQKCHLRIHQLRHTGEKSFQCDKCDRKFFTKGDVDRHERIHSGERMFECELCEKKFLQKAHLAKHQLLHTGEKPFNCFLCNRWFSVRGDLNKHQRVHSGEKPYECKLCKKRFSQNAHLTKHQLTHASEENI